MFHVSSPDRVIKMIEHCVYDRMVVTSGHTHRSSYEVLVNNGNTRVSYSQSIPLNRLFIVNLHGLSTIFNDEIY